MLLSSVLLLGALFAQVQAFESIPLIRQPTRRTSPNPNVRLAWARDQVINTRLKYRSLLDEQGHERLKRDVAAHEDEIVRQQSLAKRDGINTE